MKKLLARIWDFLPPLFDAPGWQPEPPTENASSTAEDECTLTLWDHDEPLVRAEKIWRSLGFVNDRFGAIPQMAEYLRFYRDCDRTYKAKEDV